MMEFYIDGADEEKVLKWQKSHECKYRRSDGWRDVGVTGGADSFTFTPTGIGTFVTVRCACGAELRFNDC